VILNNIRLAFRSLRKRPGLSLIIIVMLALGIGANTALFSLFHQILMAPLNVPKPQQLVNLSTDGPKWGSTSCGLSGGCKYSFSYPMFRDLESRQAAFAVGIAGFRDFRANIGYRDQTLSAGGALVSGRYFSALALQPALGRLIGPNDETESNDAVIVISHDYWKSRFGVDPDVINQTVTLNGQPFTIIGVSSAGFTGTVVGMRAQFFIPLTLARAIRPTTDRRAYWLYTFARLNPDATVDQSSASINSLFSGLIQEFDEPLNRNMQGETLDKFLHQRITLEPGARGQTVIDDNTAQALTLLLGITALVLLIVCFNVANLLLARGASRAGEIAIRASIGGSRAQIVSQLLTESIVLAVIGGIAGLPLAATTLDVIKTILPVQLATPLNIELSRVAMGFAAGVSLITVLLFGLFPAIHATRTGQALTMKEQTWQSTGGRRMARFRSTLVVAQIAFSLVLLVLAGLFSHSLINVARVNLGMDVNSVAAFSVAPRQNGYSAEKATAVLDRIEQEFAAQPGVISVGSAAFQLLAGGGAGNTITMEGSEEQIHRSNDDLTMRRNEVTPDFFKTLSIPLLAGRYFTDADRVGAPKVAIVNETFVKRIKLSNKEAIGKRFFGWPYDNVRKVTLEIVGVVGDTAYSSVKGTVSGLYFQPRWQSEEPGTATFYIRTAIQPDAVMRSIPTIVSRIDRTLPINGVRTMRRQVQENVYVDRLVTMLSAGFAGLATLLAAIGLYGVLTYNVEQRTRELGLRLALGAEPSRLRFMVLRQVGRMALIGSVIGLAAAVALGRTAQALLFGMTGTDPLVLAAALFGLSAVVFLAGYGPARRASKISPMEALRYE
jgi:predicted permease